MGQWTAWIQKIINHFGWEKYFEKDNKTLEALETLYVRGNKKERLYQLYYKRIAIFSLAIVAIAVLGVICLFSQPVGNLKEGYYLERESEEEEYNLRVDMDGVQKEMKFRLPSRRLGEEEKRELSIQVKTRLDSIILGENQNLFMVSKQLKFYKTIPDSDVVVEWFTDEEFITKEGKPIKGGIPDGGVETMVQAKACYLDWEETFSFPVFLVPSEMTAEEIMIDTVKQGIRKSIKAQKTNSVVELPKEVGGVHLGYEEPESTKDFTPVMLGMLVPVLLPFLWKEQEKRQLLRREKEMLLDHSSVVNQIMLLLSAGLTVRSGMERLVDEYEKNRSRGEGLRYVYEELWVTCNQMKNGVSEEKAIEDFGKRCRLTPYMRFAAVITQNLKKGSAGLIPLLEADVWDSFQRRKEMVKRLGEEAGTKMLFPMMMMLAVIMGVLMIPAFMTL